MSKKTIKMRLSTDSIDKVIKELQWYKKEVEFKTVQFVQRLGGEGILVISRSMSSGVGDSDFVGTEYPAHVEVEKLGTRMVATLYIKGKDVAFIEFGAGVHFNGSVGSGTDYGIQRGYTIGSYGNGKGANDYWYYRDENKLLHKSQGTKAAMPMELADKEIRSKFLDIAREVFG